MKLIHTIPLKLVKNLDIMSHVYSQFTLVISGDYLKIYEQVRV